jgi:hypothetical protein
MTDAGHRIGALGRCGLLVVALAVFGPRGADRSVASDFERDPINYSKATPENAITRLQERIKSGKTSLTCESKMGYLRSLLRELNVPESSQMLVFSKTSLQRERIAPQTPRALYFNDDLYIGYCQNGPVMEVTAMDPRLGAVFYTLDQEPAGKPRFVRQTDSCLICHGSSQTQGIPGQMVRSVYVDPDGFPILSAGSHRIDQTSPLKQRWGGWYVTGTSGPQVHLGNLIVRDKREPEEIDNSAGTNVTALDPFCRTSSYLTPHSDIVALMVLEHQAEMHNLITRANFLTRLALYDEKEINKALGRAEDYRSDSTVRRIRNAGEPLVKYMLFSGEAKLTAPVKGTSRFTEEFPQRGPRDRQGRSLRDLDLRTRLFRYPCSYLVYSEMFDALPGPVKDHVWNRLWEVLSGKDTSADFAHLSPEDRKAIREILHATKPNLPKSWQP